MKVERKDVFDFMVSLTESEFAEIKVVADEADESIEAALVSILENGYEYYISH